MDRDRRLSLTVGGFALAALAALALLVLSLSAQQGVFRAHYRLVAYFDNVQGLVAGGAVWLAGTRVGQVEEVEIATRSDGRAAVRVQLRVDEAVQERVRADSRAQIATVGLLGDQIVQISIGSESEPVLEAGAEIATVEPFDLSGMISKGGRALESIQALAANLNETLDAFQATGGTETLGETLASLGTMIREVRDGDGMLHALIFEPYQGSAISSLENTLDSLANVMHEIETGDGVFHSLVYDAPAEQDVVLEFLAAGGRLNSILGKIDRGEGTMGLLLNDPTLYEEVKLLVGGANRSTLVRSLIDMVTPEAESE